jgi:hypothetical protein
VLAVPKIQGETTAQVTHNVSHSSNITGLTLQRSHTVQEQDPPAGGTARQNKTCTPPVTQRHMSRKTGHTAYTDGLGRHRTCP